ncbi:MAG: tRNA pseudouridine(38-40) synthase TruA [Pseudomonadota bacterium]
MRNIKLTIAYDGTGYSGWQRQKNALTIQGEIERYLQIISTHPVSLHGAGRTDAGVHAKAMVANFHTESTISCPTFTRGLNSLLPGAIRILDSCEVTHDFHARFSAKAKTYTYSLFTGQIQLPMQRLYSLHTADLSHQDRIELCLQKIRGTHDFASFEASGSRDLQAPSLRGSVRTMSRAIFTKVSPETYHFQFTADGFLRHMVRNLVGTLLEAGNGRRTVLEFEETLQARMRSTAGPTAPAHGLVLDKIFY